MYKLPIAYGKDSYSLLSRESLVKTATMHQFAHVRVRACSHGSSQTSPGVRRHWPNALGTSQ